MVRRFLMALTLSAMAACCVEAAAQGAFPAPLPNPAAQGPFPAQGAAPLGGGLAAGSFGQQECMAKFRSLVADSRQRAAIISNVMESKASARHTCNMVEAYVAAQMIIVEYAMEKQSDCGIPADTITQLKARGAASQQLMSRICAGAKDELPPHFDRPPADQPRRFDLPPTSQPRLGILHINTAPGL